MNKLQIYSKKPRQLKPGFLFDGLFINVSFKE